MILLYLDFTAAELASIEAASQPGERLEATVVRLVNERLAPEPTADRQQEPARHTTEADRGRKSIFVPSELQPGGPQPSWWSPPAR